MGIDEEVKDAQRLDLAQEPKWIIDKKWFYPHPCKSNNLVFFDLDVDFLVYWAGEFIYISSNRDIA